MFPESSTGRSKAIFRCSERFGSNDPGMTLFFCKGLHHRDPDPERRFSPEPSWRFVFHALDGNPVAAIEVCSTCNRVKTTPQLKADGGVMETAVLAVLAKIASEAGLKLKPFPTLKTYLQRLNRVKKEAEGGAAGSD